MSCTKHLPRPGDLELFAKLLSLKKSEKTNPVYMYKTINGNPIPVKIVGAITQRPQPQCNSFPNKLLLPVIKKIGTCDEVLKIK